MDIKKKAMFGWSWKNTKQYFFKQNNKSDDNKVKNMNKMSIINKVYYYHIIIYGTFILELQSNIVPKKSWGGFKF